MQARLEQCSQTPPPGRSPYRQRFVEAFSGSPRRRLPLPTTTTQATWRGWTSNSPSRHHHRSLRDIQRRNLWLQGRVRSLCQPARRQRIFQGEVLCQPPARRSKNNLPMDAKFRNPKIGALAPIVVVNEVYCSGDGAHGVQTAAYNLPNDERVVQEKGRQTRAASYCCRNVAGKPSSRPICCRSPAVCSRRPLAPISISDAFFTHTSWPTN